MTDRWDEDDDLGRDRDRLRSRSREPEPVAEQTVGDVIDAAVRKIVTAVVIAGGLVALGLYTSRGGDPSVDYQITSTPDGTVYRLDSEDGRIVACRANQCWRLLHDRDDIKRDAPAQAAPAQPQPQVTQQPAGAQPTAPQNQTAPATR